jgi:hypothetical protein
VQYKKKVIWYHKACALDQAISRGVEFAFISRDFKQCCPFVLCKDFLQDAIYNQLYQTKKKIYRFQYNPSVESPICLDRVRLAVANSNDPHFRIRIPHCLDFLNQIEVSLKMGKTKVKECAKPPKKYIQGGVWLFEGSKRWIVSPPMISLYTMLIRLGFTHVQGLDFWKTLHAINDGNLTPYQSEDGERLEESLGGIKRILEEGDRKIFPRDLKVNYPKGIRICDLHNELGICAFSKGYTESLVPVWHKKKEKSCNFESCNF